MLGQPKKTFDQSIESIHQSLDRITVSAESLLRTSTTRTTSTRSISHKNNNGTNNSYVTTTKTVKTTTTSSRNYNGVNNYLNLPSIMSSPYVSQTHIDKSATIKFPEIVNYSGPYLRYVSTISATGTNGSVWNGSILIVSTSDVAPILSVTCLNDDPATRKTTYVTAKQLPNKTVLRTRHFWRFDISVPQAANTTLKYQYVINNDHSKLFTFHVAGSNEEYWNWCFYSCNGLSSDVDEAKKAEVGGIQPLWIDLLNSHKQRAFHAMVGGGDQVYADAMWYDCPNLVEWLKVEGKEERYNYPWTPQLELELNQFYFDLYVNAWSEPYLAEALATIPSINTLDDHDIWDGFGTYPEFLSKSAIFVNCARIAFDWYALFQLHTTRDLSQHDGYFGGSGSFNYIRMFGPHTALCMIDSRSERTMDQVVSNESWGMIQRGLDGLPDSVKHVMFVTGVPIIHPRLELADAVNSGFGEVKEALEGAADAVSSALPFLKDTITTTKHRLGKTGLFNSLINHFGLPELSDDLGDHWTFKNHSEERKQMILILQDIAKKKNIRFTLIGGDVHCCAAGRFFNSKNPEGRDYRLMYQITSSAIGNVPPPGLVIKNLNMSAESEYDLDDNTREQQIMLFKHDVDGSKANAYTLGRRNYAICYQGRERDSLAFCIKVEPAETGDSIGYELVIPPVQ